MTRQALLCGVGYTIFFVTFQASRWAHLRVCDAEYSFWVRFGIGSGGRVLRGGASTGHGGSRVGVGVGPFSIGSGSGGGGSGLGRLVLAIGAVVVAAIVLVEVGARLLPVVIALPVTVGTTVFLIGREAQRRVVQLLYLVFNGVLLVLGVALLRSCRSALESAALNIPRESENDLSFREMLYSGLADGCSIAIWLQAIPVALLVIGCIVSATGRTLRGGRLSQTLARWVDHAETG